MRAERVYLPVRFAIEPDGYPSFATSRLVRRPLPTDGSGMRFDPRRVGGDRSLIGDYQQLLHVNSGISALGSCKATQAVN
jgi:hypothetical protein